MLHNVPEEFAMAIAAVVAGRRRFVLRAAVVSAAAEPAGALVGLAGVAALPQLDAVLLAFAAGAMVFVSFHELVPMARTFGRLREVGLGAAGGVIVLAGLQAVTSS
jgi:ZIP family zinc transporter